MGKIIKKDAGMYVCPAAGQERIASQEDLLELLSLCAEARIDKLLFPRDSLAEDFFDLSTGLAGEIALKLATYRVKTALVVDLASIPSQRFQEWAGECNRGQEIHFFPNLQSARDWLLAD